MIRKVMLFVLLLGAGFAVMHFVVGAENFAKIGADDVDEPIKTIENAGNSGFVVGEMDDTNSDSAITIKTSGALRIPHTREIELPDGTRRSLDDYVLDAEDSRPHPTLDDRMQLFRVDVALFEIDEADPWRPTAALAATLRANEAVLQVGRDEKGRPSIREDRDMDLIDVVVRSAEGAKVEDLEMRLPRVLVRHTPAGLALRTPNDETPFEIDLGGDEPMTLTGEGLRAVLPADDVAGDRYLELHVAKRPVLVRGASTLSAEGRLDFVEDVATGIGTVELRDGVRASGVLSRERNRPIRAFGDMMTARLARRGEKQDEGGAWLDFVVTGSPMELHSDRGVLECARLDAWPGVDGEPTYFSASGSPRLVQERNATFEAQRIHLVRADKLLAALHAPFGFAIPTGSIAEQFLVFEGHATVDQRAEKTRVEASDGIRVLRSADADGPAMSIGFGHVSVVREDLTARGNDGFVLSQAADGSQRMQLGPSVASAEHAFAMRHPGERTVDVEGHGSCELIRRADGSARMILRSPTADIVATADGSAITAAGTCIVETDATGELAEFSAAGDAVGLVHQLEDGVVTGTAMAITSDTPDRIVLHGSPAIAERPSDGSVVRGGSIAIQRVGSDAFVVDVLTDRARGRADPVRAHVTVVSLDDPEAVPVDVTADHIRFLPYAIPPVVARIHTGMRLHAWDCVVGAGVRARHVVGEGDVEVWQAGERAFHAYGDRFVSRVDDETGYLVGSPARIENEAEDGRRGRAFADMIRIERDAGVPGLALLPTERRKPIIEMYGLAQAGDARNLRVECDGVVDALADEVAFRSPVVVTEIDARGEPVADGLRLDAEGMSVDGDTRGDVRVLTATGEATLRIEGVTARGDEIVIDLQHSRATIFRERGMAEVELPTGRICRGTRLEVDYVEFLVTAWHVQSESQ